MKKVLLVFAVLFVLLCSLTCYAETVQTKLEIDEGTTTKSITTGFLGINDTWMAGALYIESGNADLKLSDKYKNAVHSNGIPINQMRMAGADAHDFKWKESLGPLKERGNGAELGLVEWIRCNKELNPDAELTFTLNIIRDSIKDHKDLVRFLMLDPDDANAVDEDGFNWAQYRVDLGIKEPVKIRVFELGNEVYYNYVDGCTEGVEVPSAAAGTGADAYISDCKEIIAAMKSVKSDLTFSVADFSYTAATMGSAQAWNSRVVNQLYQDCAYITHHQYFYDYNFYQLSQQLKTRLLDYISALPVAEDKKPRVYMSEYGYWMDKSLDNLRVGTSFSGTLTMAKYLNFLANTPYVELANVHVTNEKISTDASWPSGWDLFRYYDNGNIYATVPTEMLKIFNSALENTVTGKNVIEARLGKTFWLSSNNYWANYLNYPDGEDTPAGLLNASAYKTKDGGINLILVNTSETVEHNLNITYQSGQKYKVVEKEVLTSENLTDNNLPGSDNSVYVKRYTINDASEFKSFTMPTKSIVLLKLLPIASSRTENSIHFVGDSTQVQGVVHVGKNFGIQMVLYENETDAAVSDMDLYIIKNTVSPESFIANPNAFMNEVVYVGASGVKRNYLYYDIVMPSDAEDGTYYAIIGNPKTSFYRSTEFSYDKEEQGISNIKVDSVSRIVEDENTYSLAISANADFEGKPVAMKIYQKSDGGMFEQGVVYLGKFTANRKIKEQVKIPAGSVAGDYVIEFMWEDQGKTKSVTSEFVFEKIDEQISIYGYPTNEEEQPVNVENILSSDKMFVTLANQKETAADVLAIVAEYDRNNELLAINMSRATLNAKAAATPVEIALNDMKPLDAGGYIKLFVWKDGNIEPCNNVTYIK